MINIHSVDRMFVLDIETSGKIPSIIINSYWRCKLSNMTIMEKVYFIGAWVVAGCSGLALILYAVATRGNGLAAFGVVLDGLFFGATGCLVLLHLSGWFRNSLVMFIMAWVVAGLAALSLILTAAAHSNGSYIVGTIFWHVALGGFCSVLLLHLSERFNKAK